MDDKQIASLKSLFDACEDTLKLPRRFLAELFLDANDWSFVVKSHALLEAAVCSYLALHLRRPELEDAFAASLDMSRTAE